MSDCVIPVSVVAETVIPVSIAGGSLLPITVSGALVADVDVSAPTALSVTKTSGQALPVAVSGGAVKTFSLIGGNAITLSLPLASRVPASEDADMRMDGFVLSNAASFVPGGDWVSGDSDTSWLVLPTGTVRYPRLRESTVIFWEISSLWYNSSGSAQIIDWELMIDGAPSGIMFSWSDNTTCILNSRLMFSANLQSLWEPTGGWTYELECRLRLRDQTDTTRFDSTLGKQLALDPTDDRDLAWRVRKRNAATGNGLLVRGHAAWQPVWRKGT